MPSTPNRSSDAASRGLELYARVIVQTDDHYNGKRGRITGFDEGEPGLPWLVQLDGFPPNNPCSFAGEELVRDV